MRLFTFECDGCGAKPPASYKPDLPQSYADISITAIGFTSWRPGGSKEVRHSKLLCGPCQHHLVGQIDPSNWPRAMPEASS